MGRKAIKQKVNSYIATVSGVTKVYDGVPKNIDQKRLPCIVISIPDQAEERVTVTAPNGKKRIAYTVRLAVMTIDTGNDAVASELVFDDLLDAIYAKLRAYPTLGDTVAGAGIKFIRTDVAEPRLTGMDGGNMFRLATIEFDVTDIVTG